jgi:hypothetical protein
LKPSDRRAFLEIVIGFAELRGKQLSAPALELYWNAMQDWELADFQAAANRLLKTCEWMPLPHHFEALLRAGRSTAAEAWIEARKWIKWGLHGYTIVEGAPPMIAQSIRAIGGANVLGMCDEDKLTFLERRFVEHYQTIEDATDTREALPQLAGPLHPRLAAGLKRIAAPRPALEAAKS